MKKKISITVDEGMIGKIEDLLRGSRFRNRSHVVEFGLRRLLEVEDE